MYQTTYHVDFRARQHSPPAAGAWGNSGGNRPPQLDPSALCLPEGAPEMCGKERINPSML